MKKNEQRSRGRKGRFVTVNDRMQTGYCYELSAPMGRNFDPEFKPQLTPQQMLALGVFCGKYMTDGGNEFPKKLVQARQARAIGARLFTQLFWCWRQQATL